MPTKINAGRNPAIQTALKIYEDAQRRLKKMQQPSEGTSPLAAAIMGGLGGAGEAALSLFGSDDEEDLVMNAVMGSANPLGMVRIPNKYVTKFAENFKKVIPRKMEQIGQPELAQITEDFAKRYPRSAGQLQEVNALPLKRRYAEYATNIIPEPKQTDDINFDTLADLGMTAPSNNAIRIDPTLHNPDPIYEQVLKTLQIPTANLEESFTHEATHLAQDILGRGDRGEHLLYQVRPNEVLARLAAARQKVTPENVIKELETGLNNYHNPDGIPTNRPGGFPYEDVKYNLITSFGDIMNRAKGPDWWKGEAFDNLVTPSQQRLQEIILGFWGK